jgi:D-inositol-3-phosphate glycosyltransferase
MQSMYITEESPSPQIGTPDPVLGHSANHVEIGLLTGCKDRPYVFGLTMALASAGVYTEIVGSDDLDCPEMRAAKGLRFLNFYGSHSPTENLATRLWKVLHYYFLLMRYAAHSTPGVFHILWNNKFELFDRTILMLYYRACGKRIAFTAHNVNQGQRDGKDSWLNRVTLKIQYHLCDHIFVHTQRMKDELCRQFAVMDDAVTVIRFPVNNASPETTLTCLEAKQRLGLSRDEKTILFFGRIRPYKGVEYLLDAFRTLVGNGHTTYRLIIAGEPIKGCEVYLQEIQKAVGNEFDSRQVMWKTQFIPDHEVEIYFKAADVLVLPYKEIFQSGVLFLAYAYGLPVVATDVGSFSEDIVAGSTGFLCKAGDPRDMAAAIEQYFASGLFKTLDASRQTIKEYVHTHHSWDAVAAVTAQRYASLQ